VEFKISSPEIPRIPEDADSRRKWMYRRQPSIRSMLVGRNLTMFIANKADSLRHLAISSSNCQTKCPSVNEVIWRVIIKRLNV